MDEDGIGLVLARASELRSKINNCIHSGSGLQPDRYGPREGTENGEKDSPARPAAIDDEDEKEDETTETLLNIRDALESLEAQLSSLQALQQQQWYDREAALAEIDCSRKKLLKQLSEYKGHDIEIIHEATAFASEKVEESNDLLLPPYPPRPSLSISSDKGSRSHFPVPLKYSKNGPSTIQITNESSGSKSKTPLPGVRLLINGAIKTVVTLVGVMTVLNLMGLEPRVQIRARKIKFFDFLLPQHGDEGGERETVHCPPGKVLLVENGDNRCVVKERVEIPFEPVVARPDVNYGWG